MRSARINLLLFAIPALLFVNCANEKPALLLPVYGEKKAAGKDTVYHTISDFDLINQYGENVSLNTIKGKIVVANFFFATCQSICPEMSTNLVDVQKEFELDDSLLILSHSARIL
jgi:protein SCO1